MGFLHVNVSYFVFKLKQNSFYFILEVFGSVYLIWDTYFSNFHILAKFYSRAQHIFFNHSKIYEVAFLLEKPIEND
jgi:hypothetical protein